MYDVTMPKLSDSMEVGKILSWKVKEGDAVHEGDVLAEVESDKAAMDLECFHDGVLAQVLQGDGAEVAVGAVIARIAAAGEAPAASQEKAVDAERPAPRPHAERRDENGEKRRDEREGEAPAEPPRAGEAPAEPPLEPPAGGRAAASPLARKLAREHGIDLAQLRGSGPDGRIVAADVEAAIKAAAPPAIKPSADEELPPLEVTPDEADVEEAPFRLKTQARRVTASKHVIPHFYMTRGADVTALLARKEELKAKFGASVTHLVMLAALKTLAQHPEANRSYDRGKIIKWKNVNLGLAVDAEGGLTVAVLRKAQGLSLRDLVERVAPLVERARAGKLAAEERQHATFTITNLGMFDVEHFQPIVNPPSAITLAVASALPTPVVRGEAIEIGKVMGLTLSCDHRIVDGVTAARFLRDLKALLEDPAALLG